MNHYIYALGFFDGVHIGHQALLKAVGDLCSGDTRPGVITFAAHPDTLVTGQTPKLINTPQDRVKLLKRYGMERVVTLPFDKKMCATSWQDFLAGLQSSYAAVGFVCGEDFRFGYRGQGTADSLGDYCKARHLSWAVVPEQIKEGIRVSSTAIRQELEEGHMEKAVSGPPLPAHRPGGPRQAAGQDPGHPYGQYPAASRAGHPPVRGLCGAGRGRRQNLQRRHQHRRPSHGPWYRHHRGALDPGLHRGPL